jgi:diguanylate cyclase (GGDEF)-like protein/PAS domain S-box-containing protein
VGQSTRRGRAHEPLTESSETRRLRALLSSMRDVVLVRDRDGLLTYCSPSVFEALGYHPSELEGTPERDLVHESDLGARDGLISLTLPDCAAAPTVDLRLRDRSGEWHWFEVIETDRLDDPDVQGIVTTARDVTDHRAENAELRERSLRDPLTGIPNRIALLERLEMAMARSSRAHDIVAVLFCDLDDFKLVNDGYGHDYGDQVLIEVVRRMQDLQRKSDTVARIGGDEFAIVCDGLHRVDEASLIASRIHRAVEAPIVIAGRECFISVSIGIATISGKSGEELDPQGLLRNADAAMYRAKARGHAQWHHFDDTLFEEAARRFELEADLAPGLERGEFVLHYEPIHQLFDRTTVGVEASLRWEHPTLGFLQPNEFLTIAEQTGMIVPIGAWAMRAACIQARLWSDAGWSGWMSVNVCGRELGQTDLARNIITVLDETGLDPDRLWLELTESAFLRVNRSTTRELDALREHGVHVGIDDFGTASTPLPMLQRLPADFLKIDRSFVADLTAGGEMHPAGCAIVAALVQVGDTLGLSVIAEGIHSEIETELLVECGCKYGQGELPAVPTPSGVRAPLRP